MNRLDSVMQSVCPAVMVPRHEALTPMNGPGHRFLVAADGVYLDLARSWLRLTTLTAASAVAMPYGSVAERVDFGFGADFACLVARFIDEARSACPIEHAAWLVFDESARQLDYSPVHVAWGSVGRVRYHRPTASATRHPAVDLHSHGRMPAFFSATDDVDDTDDAKLAIVVGNLGDEVVSVAARLIAAGLCIDYSEWISTILNAAGYAVVVPDMTGSGD